MGIFSRISSILKSNVNDLINSAEDPEKMLNQAIIDMRSQLIDAKKQVASAIADEKRLQKQLETELTQSRDYEQKAMIALTRGDEGLAREALVRKTEHANLASQYQKQWEQQKNSVEQLKTALRRLSSKIEEAARKKQLLLARQKRAEAQKQIHETMSALSESSAFENFQRMEKKIDEIEAQAEAQQEIGLELGGDSLDEKLLALESGENTADQALLELKAKLGLLPKNAGGMSDQPLADDSIIHDPLEELKKKMDQR
jgi:phage shock protein A